MPGVTDLASARGHMGTKTNQGSRIDYITAKPGLHHQMGMRRAPIFGIKGQMHHQKDLGSK